MQLSVARTYGPNATTGVCRLAGLLLYTVELAWHDNEPDKSCVAEGTFDLIPYMSPTHGPTWCLHAPSLGLYAFDFGKAPKGFEKYAMPKTLVGKARAFSEIHSANWARQLLGCIAFGLDGAPMLDPSTGKAAPAVERSQDAIRDILTILTPMSEGHQLVLSAADLASSPAKDYKFEA